jgi:hypothetical protein
MSNNHWQDAEIKSEISMLLIAVFPTPLPEQDKKTDTQARDYLYASKACSPVAANQVFDLILSHGGANRGSDHPIELLKAFRPIIKELPLIVPSDFRHSDANAYELKTNESVMLANTYGLLLIGETAVSNLRQKLQSLDPDEDYMLIARISKIISIIVLDFAFREAVINATMAREGDFSAFNFKVTNL